jgi:hypothetical protein
MMLNHQTCNIVGIPLGACPNGSTASRGYIPINNRAARNSGKFACRIFRAAS